MISNVLLHKNLWFVCFFQSGSFPIPDKIYHPFTSSNPDFPVLPRCYVHECTDCSQGKNQQLSDATQVLCAHVLCARNTSVLMITNKCFRIMITMAATACNIRVIVRADYYVTHGHDPDMEAMPGVEDITFQIE